VKALLREAQARNHPDLLAAIASPSAPPLPKTPLIGLPLVAIASFEMLWKSR
jgi:hypothetical protein